ncbi:hypothetical protein L6164_004168 [Bauhinia variegata]|uniref:Uncharacterized protein n=1 Tax=Bauhinia variegata TaxID=167791 RepID=A0ACB9Q3I6_BAUVA|nr:hypothetical protein L6164_004168 [Bauhinia variegata]
MGVRGSKLKKLLGGHKRLEAGSVSTPRGYVPICVGMNESSSRRFMVHARTLGDVDFSDFLCRSVEEYGFRHDGVLRIPFEAQDFEQWMITRSNHKIKKVKPA